MRSTQRMLNEAADDQESWSDAGPDGSGKASPAHHSDPEKGGRGSERPPSAQYGLTHPGERDSERRRLDTVDSSPARMSLALPAREVTLSAERVDHHLTAFFETDRHVSEQYDKLAISLILAAANQPLKRVLLASAHGGDGRTSVVLNLACSLAHAKQRVLVIDADLRRPSVLRLLGVDAEIGLAEALAEDLPLGAAVMRVLPFGFDVLPSRKSVDNSTKVLASPAFREMLATLDHLYDFILFDSPPLLETASSHLLVHLADTTVLVIRAGRMSSTQLAKAVTPLREENLFGVVLSRVAQ